MKRVEKGRKLTIEMTPAELLEWARGYGRPESYARTGEMSSSFCAFSWGATVDMLARGWDEGVARMSTAIDSIRGSEGYSNDPELTRDVSGLFFDPALVAAGNPEPWYRQEEVEVPQEEITVWANVSARCGVSQETTYNRGAVICNVIDALSKKYFVKCVFHCGGEGMHGYKWYDFEIRIMMDTKNGYSRALVAFLAAHPGVLRRLMFGMMEQEQDLDSCGGYGKPISDTATHGKGNLVFGPIGSGYGFLTIEQARKTVDAALKEFANVE